jgi:hypothetical protein
MPRQSPVFSKIPLHQVLVLNEVKDLGRGAKMGLNYSSLANLLLNQVMQLKQLEISTKKVSIIMDKFRLLKG